jgi:hypothetical protein
MHLKHLMVRPGKVFPGAATSACLSHTRKQGGKGQAVYDVLGPDRIQELRLKAKELGGAFFSYSIGFVKEAAEAIAAMPASYDSKPIPVFELGWKVRVVSCSDVVRTCHSEAWRKPLFGLLKKIRPCSLPLRGDMVTMKFTSLQSWYRGRKPDKDTRFLFSADLSAATDNLTWPAIRAVCDGLGVPFDLVAGGTLNGKPMTRGTLMGIPCSWTILSLCHFLAIEVAQCLPKGSYFLKGDDLLGYWSSFQISRYSDALAILGIPLNKQKTLTSKDVGIFCEKVYHLTEVHKNHAVAVMDHSVLSLRPFVDTAESEDRLPAAIAARDYLWSRIPPKGADTEIYGRARRLSVLLDKKDASHKCGAWSYLPPELGGLSRFPPRGDAIVPLKWSGALTAIYDGDLELASKLSLRRKVLKDRSSLENYVHQGFKSLGPLSYNRNLPPTRLGELLGILTGIRANAARAYTGKIRTKRIGSKDLITLASKDTPALLRRRTPGRLQEISYIGTHFLLRDLSSLEIAAVTGERRNMFHASLPNQIATLKDSAGSDVPLTIV